MIASSWAAVSQGLDRKLGARSKALYPEYRDDPVGFARDVLGCYVWGPEDSPTGHEGQVGLLRKIAANAQTEAIASRGVGKTFAASIVVPWWLESRENGVVVSTSSTFNQVEQVLWRNVRQRYALAKRPLLGRCLTTKVELGPAWYGYGFSSDKPDNVRGFHSMADVFQENEHEGGILVLVDEASGVGDEIMDALDGFLTGRDSKLVYITNPTRRRGRAYEAHRSADFAHFQVSAFDAPERLVSREWIEKQRRKYGPNEEQDPRWAAYVRGVYPVEGDDSLFPLWILDRARFWTPETNEVRMGVDIARKGSDRSVAVLLRNGRVAQIAVWRGKDLMESARRVLRAAKSWGVPSHAIAIDIGMGAGVIDRLRELGHRVTAVDFGSGPTGEFADLVGEEAKFKNRRAELFWALRIMLERGRLSVSDRWADLWTELQQFGYEYDRLEKMVITPKEEIVAALGHSPDLADALACAIAAPVHHRVFASAT